MSWNPFVQYDSEWNVIQRRLGNFAPREDNTKPPEHPEVVERTLKDEVALKTEGELTAMEEGRGDAGDEGGAAL